MRFSNGTKVHTHSCRVNSVNWTYVSPPALIGPGCRIGKYRIGGDQLLTDAAGTSTISWIDFAAALIDELETNAHPKSRITVAY